MKNFSNKEVDVAWEYLDSLAKNSPTWKTEDTSERDQSTTTSIARGGPPKLGEIEDIAMTLVNPHQES